MCNVLGLPGVQVMMEDAARTPLKAMVTTPSCVPAVPGLRTPARPWARRDSGVHDLRTA